jgi:hypothetical protein
MTLEPHAFMTTMEKRIVFTNEDKALLKSQSDWGKKLRLIWQSISIPTWVGM